MKKIILLFSALVCVTFTYSQNCNLLLEGETDKMTGKYEIFTKNPIKVFTSSDYGISIKLARYSDRHIFSFYIYGASHCVDDKGKILVLFRDGQRSEMVNMSGFNCDNYSSVHFSLDVLNHPYYQEFATKEIEAIRVWTYKGYVQVDLNSTQSKQVMQLFQCMQSM